MLHYVNPIAGLLWLRLWLWFAGDLGWLFQRDDKLDLGS
jgi:hypothetical protein